VPTQTEEGGPMKKHHIAQHEAAHAVVAQKMGLPVEWVSIEWGKVGDIHFAAAVSIPDDQIDKERDKLAICVAMAAPSHIHTHRDVSPELWRYSQMEADLAYEIAGRAGIEFREVYDLSVDMLDVNWPEIIDLAHRLEAEGKVMFDLAVA
jgi:hypothetical protein